MDKLFLSNLARGIANISVRQTATTAANTSVWAIRNGGSGILYIRQIWLQLWFDGTGAATEMKYELVKGTACSAMSGGSAVTTLFKRTGIDHSAADARVLDTGLTQTGVVQGAAFFNAAWARLTHSATQAGGVSNPFLLDFDAFPIELANNEVLSLRNGVTAVIGDNVAGGVEFFG